MNILAGCTMGLAALAFFVQVIISAGDVVKWRTACVATRAIYFVAGAVSLLRAWDLIQTPSPISAWGMATIVAWASAIMVSTARELKYHPESLSLIHHRAQMEHTPSPMGGP